MASMLRKSHSFLILFTFAVILISNCFTEIRSYAQLIPQDEVKALQIISGKLKNQYWKTVSPTSCDDGGTTFNKTFAENILANVTCDCSFNRGTVCHVTNIQLKGLNLSGVLPAEFGNLTHLQEIDLSRNYIAGPIPISLSKIPLVILSLLGNRNSGQIPDEIGQIANLEELILEDNELGGPLPPNLGNLKNLRRLVLSGNNFNGTIPETYGNLKNLTEVRLNGNMISGKIPDFIGNWTKENLRYQYNEHDFPKPDRNGKFAISVSYMFLGLTTTNYDLYLVVLQGTEKLLHCWSNASFYWKLVKLEAFVSLSSVLLAICTETKKMVNNLTPYYRPELQSVDWENSRLNAKLAKTCISVNTHTRTHNHICIHLAISSTIPSARFLTNNSLSGSLPRWIQYSNQKFDVSYNNFTGSSLSGCQQSNVITELTPPFWLYTRNLVSNHSLFINCGGSKMSFEGRSYEEDSSPGGPSTFFSSGEKWAYSSTGAFLYRDSANFLAQETSNPNVTSIYQTARLAPLSLKYYGLCLRPGSYVVTLHFAEIMYSDDQTFAGLGRRFFDVEIQGNVVLKDFNIAAEAGGAGKPITKTFPKVYVNDSTLEIYLYWAGRGTTSLPDRGAYGPLISGITVTPNFKTGSGLSAGAIASIVLASCAILVLILVLLRMRGYLGGKGHENEEFRGLDTGYFTLRQIKAATDDFNHRNKIGEGGFGPVFKGVLPDGKVIAVKQLSSKSKQGNREFVNEIGMISALQHPNLVKLYGCCIEGKELLLTVSFPSFVNFSQCKKYLGQEDQKLHLDWPTRKRICLGIARGLAYLHEESRLKIVHRDIKATNVLLDKDLNAKISDFGLAKLDEEENTHISTRIAGTIGYMAPEYAMRGYLTDKADVYSFGVVVLELVSGKSNTNYRPKEEFVYLLDMAYVLQEQGNILELVDPSLGSNYSDEEALRLLNLALLCANPSPTLRPTMSSVVSMIDGKHPVQAPIIKRKGMNENLRFKALEILSQDSQTHISMSSQFTSEVQRSISMDGPWMDSSISMPSKDDAPRSSSSSNLLPN
ncbi:LOW QUALITY PROTEIN: hypothetical protein Cgig2_018188 [Carnegiea gigantea]|uniref:non-specific serine/threonine protein kinase n=1 Tax=Carnegiea gigantea TaxID=171969 RepID=A0A9Q1KZ39_9CARY|nr:LOW QUALITY PROTEIN: hypothetical protein Cgig2_018188 [Carnegiea gigantea]